MPPRRPTNGCSSSASRATSSRAETYLFDRDTKKLALQYRIREKLPRAALAPMKPVTYASSDGLQIPAYLTLPAGVAPKNLPAIIFPHGGPWARDNWGYSAFAQFLANRGYAVLMPNFRGSTGYGKKFLDAGNRQWGEKMQDDVTWGAKYLVARASRTRSKSGSWEARTAATPRWPASPSRPMSTRPPSPSSGRPT